jgi:hypothetical protein
MVLTEKESRFLVGSLVQVRLLQAQLLNFMLGSKAPISLTLGQLGSALIADTTTHTGPYGAIQALATTVVDTLVSGKLADGTTACMTGTLTGFTIPVGAVIYGIFTSIKLTSGVVIAYKI